MKNFITKKYRVIYFKGIRLLMLSILLILTFQLFATSKLHVETQKDNLSWKIGIDSELINAGLNRIGNDVIFISGFEPVPIILAFTANPTIINAGDSTALTWELSNNATECIKSGDWSGTAAFTNGIHGETISNIMVDSTYQLQCSNNFGESRLISVQVSVINSGQPPILTLSANPTTVNSGGSSTITWTLANDATTCTKSGDWTGVFTGSAVTNGSHSLLVENITSNSTFNLVCVNSTGSSPSRTATVLVNNGSPNCANQPPILNGDEDFTIKLIPGVPFGQPGSPSDPATYDGTYDDIAPGSGWPGILGTASFFNLTSNKYIAMQFVTDNTNAIARLVFTVPGNGQGPPSTATTVAISECPGDFTTHLNQSRCLRVGGAVPNLRWSQNPNTNALTHCILEKNKTYYLNIVHSNSIADGYSTTGCTSTNCGGIFSHTDEQN